MMMMERFSTSFATKCWLLAWTIYVNKKKNLEEFIEAKSERQFLNSWIKWWDSRRVFIFGAFTPKNAPKLNLAEFIHAGWSNRDSPKVSLLDAAQMDAKAVFHSLLSQRPLKREAP